MRRSLADVVKCPLLAIAIITCRASSAGATLISVDMPIAGQSEPSTLISTMAFEGGEAGLFLTGSGLRLEIVRFGDGQNSSTSLTDENSSSGSGSYGGFYGGGNPYFPSGFQSPASMGSPYGSPSSSSTSSLNVGVIPSLVGGLSWSAETVAPLTTNPEPSTMILLGTGVAGLIRRRMCRRAAREKTKARIVER
jgi:hypothetical protein